MSVFDQPGLIMAIICQIGNSESSIGVAIIAKPLSPRVVLSALVALNFALLAITAIDCNDYAS